MLDNKHLFTGLIVLVLAVVIGLWGYYTFTTSGKIQLPVYEQPVALTAKTEPLNPLPPVNEPPSLPITKTTPIKKGTQENIYQVPDGEKSLHFKAVEFLKPLAFMNRREPYNDPYAFKQNHEANLQDMINLYNELLRQYPNSPYCRHYQEAIKLLQQMKKEDKEFKYEIRTQGKRVGFMEDKNDRNRKLSPDEMVECYIHYLRYADFNENTPCKIVFEEPSVVVVGFEPILPNLRLVYIGTPAVPAVVKLLEDRRPIIVSDDTKIPAVFYRYQDAAVEILEHITKRKLPIELPETEYFSEYIAQQTPEKKQQIISDIKTWVEETLKNTPDTPPDNK
jgi:hypothetical protein